MNIVSKEMNEEFDRRIDRGIEKSKEWIRSHTYGSASQKAGLAVGSILEAMKTPEEMTNIMMELSPCCHSGITVKLGQQGEWCMKCGAKIAKLPEEKLETPR